MVDYFPTLRELVVFRRYGLADRDCAMMIWHKRHGNPDKCLRCGRPTSYRLADRNQLCANGCKHTISPLIDTIFYRTHIPLTIWFDAIYQIMISDGHIPSAELARRHNLTMKSAERLKGSICNYLGIAARIWRFEFSSMPAPVPPSMKGRKHIHDAIDLSLAAQYAQQIIEAHTV